MRVTCYAPAIFGVGLMVAASDAALSQAYPSKLIRIATSGAGGGSDFTARLIAQGVTGALGQPVIVDNRANSVIAAEFVAKSPPDGYTLLSWGNTMWIGALARKNAV